MFGAVTELKFARRAFLEAAFFAFKADDLSLTDFIRRFRTIDDDIRTKNEIKQSQWVD